MLRSMSSGVSGMKNYQEQLDVIGNNIANVNTSGFKKGRMTFQDMFSQMTEGAQGPTDEKGGVNPKQVGLGSQEGSIDNIHTQGSSDTTGRMLDFAIEGDGMFVVGEEDGSGDVEDVAYTRAGNFYMDEDGNLVNSDGKFLMGFDTEDGDIEDVDDIDPVDEPEELVKINIPDGAEDVSVEKNGTVNYIDEEGETEVAGFVSLANFSNPEGLQKDGDNLYLDSANAGREGFFTPDLGGTGSLQTSTLEMSNVDMAEEFSDMIKAQRSFQANTRIITTSDDILQELVNLKQ